MKRFLYIFVLSFALYGCKTVIEISTKGEPENFDPIVLSTELSYYYSEVEVDVPADIRDEEWEVTRVDMFGDITAQYIDHPVDVELYIGLVPGSDNLDNPVLNSRIAYENISQPSTAYDIEVRSPPLALQAMRQNHFYIKAVITTATPTVGIVRVGNVYLDVTLERDSSGLFPIFYLF
jgi:hypothetical protein